MTKSSIIPDPDSVRRGLSMKFLIMLLAGAAVTLICSALFGYYHAHKLRTALAGIAMQRVAEKVSGEIEISQDMAMQAVRQLAVCAELAQALTEPTEEENFQPTDDVLASFASTHTGIQALKVVNSDGEIAGRFGEWTATDITIDGGEATVYEPIAKGNPVSTVIPMCVPIPSRLPGTPPSVLCAEYRLNHIIARLMTNEDEMFGILLHGPNQRELFVLSPSHLASPRPVSFTEDDGSIVGQRSGWSTMRFAAFNMDTLAGYAPVKQVLASMPSRYKGRDWSVVSAIPQSQALTGITSLFLQAVLFGGAVLAFVAVIGLAFAQRMLAPIRMLQAGVQEIGQGNLEHRIDVRSGDEIEALASEFNRMADRMQRTQEQLQRRSSELKQRVNQLRRLQAQLMQSERMAATGELAAQIAHEINNPLGIIKNYVGIAKMLMQEDDSNRENLKVVDQEINRIAGIVRRLLKFAKPGTEDIQSVQINQIIEELLALLRGQLFRRKIEVLSELAKNLPEVSVSTDQMRQVFLNLIKNAEDAMPEGGKLSVRTRYRKGRVEIEIEDSGCGIPSDDVKNIFEPFFTTKGVKGTGLGLSVSYGIIKNYNGEIVVESEPGRGTTFIIQLPVVSDKVFQVIQSS